MANKVKKRAKRKTKPPRRWKFIVNSMGEIFRNDQCLVSSCNLGQLCARLGVEWDQLPDYEVLDYFEQEMRQQLTPLEYKVARWIESLQAINDDRFRVYGGINGQDQVEVRLVTEFTFFVDQTELGGQLEDLALACGCQLETMFEGPFVDKHWPAGVWPAEMPPAEREACAVRGPNDGRMERQVELVWNIPVTARRLDVQRQIEVLTGATAQLWTEHGVSVI